MSIKVKYQIIFKEKDENDTVIDPNKVINTIKRDISWGTYIPYLHAIDATLNTDSAAKKFQPTSSWMDENRIVLEFHSNQFNFHNEGINHFISTIGGDIIRNSAIKSIVVEDFEFDQEDIQYFKGPKLGISNIRTQLLKGTLKGDNRPIVAFSIKPRMGMTVDEYKEIITAAAKSDIDIIEEDERLVDPTYCPFEQRVQAIQKVIKETKTKSQFSVNLSGHPWNIKEKALQAYNAGVRIFKLDVLSTGFDVLIYLRNILDLKEIMEPVAITVFPDIYGEVYRSLSREFILKLSRLCGADIMYAGSPHLSRMGSISKKDFERDISRLMTIHRMLRSKTQNINSTLPTITHDVHPGLLETIVYSFRILGPEHLDYAFFIGGGISGFPAKGGVLESCSVWMSLIKHASDVNLKQHHSLEKIEEIKAFNLEGYEQELRKMEWYNDLFTKR